MASRRKAGHRNATEPRPVNLPRSVFFAAKSSAAVRSPLPSVQPEKRELAKMLSRFELFSGLPLAAVEEIASVAAVRAYHRGEFIWRRGEKVSDIVLLDSGFVKVARRDRAGASKTYGLYGPGDAIGLFAMCAGMKHSIDAVALNEGLRTICIDASAISKFAENSATLSANLRNELTRFTEALINKIEVISAGTMPQRLAVLMMQLIERYGVDRKGTRARVPFSLTLSQISEIIGARLETVGRVLGDWKRAGWLTTDAGGFDFSRLDKLRELLPD